MNNVACAASLESLESRTLRSVSLDNDNGVLNITGSANNDAIVVWRDAKDVTKLDVKVNNTATHFDLADVNSIFIRTFRGNDSVKLLSRDVFAPTTIYTDGGADDVDVSGGAMRIYLGSGNDQAHALGVKTRVIMYGGDGDDMLHGGYGNDLLDGGDGNDTLNGFAGANKCFGGAGNDLITANNIAGSPVRQGNNLLDGGDGNDTLLGGTLDDSMNGGAGDDVLFGFAGNDSLSGGDGEDDLDGGNGADVLHGDAGNDDLVGIDAQSALVDHTAGDDSDNANTASADLLISYAAAQ